MEMHAANANSLQQRNRTTMLHNKDTNQQQHEAANELPKVVVKTEPTNDKPKPESTVWNVVRKVLTAGGMGVMFGALFARSRVFEPLVIRGQFIFKHNAMLTMFMGAAGASAASFLLLLNSPWGNRFHKARAKKESAFTARSYAGIFGGSCLTGIGMALGGACPGMVLAQVGAGVEYSYLTFIGGFVGALLHGLLDPFIKHKLLHEEGSAKRPETIFVDVHLGISTRKMLAVLSVLCIGVATCLEVTLPWYDEFQKFPRSTSTPNFNVPDCNWVTGCRAIRPSVAGVLLGFLQLPALLGIGAVLGASTSYSVVMSIWTNFTSTANKEKFDYMAKYGKPDIATWWQVVFVSSAITGSYLAEISAGGIVHPPGVGPIASFFGGLMMVFGSRVANGCTSGHGITGMTTLMKPSFVAVGGMFGAGILTGTVWNAISPETYMPV